MSDAVLVALISGAISLVGIILTTKKSNAELIARLDKQSEIADIKLEGKLDTLKTVTDAKLDELARAVHEYTSLAGKLPVLEVRMEDFGKSLLRVHARIDSVEALITKEQNPN